MNLEGILCDGCGDDYGSGITPHMIKCGHLLCSSCCFSIFENSSSTSPASCPFCHKRVTRRTIRPPLIPVFPDPGEVRRLESKVARAESTECPVEEIIAVQIEVDRWLTEVTAADGDPCSALLLNSSLLKAILAKLVASSDASKSAEHVEASLRSKVNELKLEKNRLQVELQKQNGQYNQKVQECQSLRKELSRFVTAPAVSAASAASSVRAAHPLPVPRPGLSLGRKAESIEEPHGRAPITIKPDSFPSPTQTPSASTRRMNTAPTVAQVPTPPVAVEDPDDERAANPTFLRDTTLQLDSLMDHLPATVPRDRALQPLAPATPNTPPRFSSDSVSPASPPFTRARGRMSGSTSIPRSSESLKHFSSATGPAFPT